MVLSITPYVRPEILALLDTAVIVLPISALVLSLIAAWHLGAEYQRLRMVTERFDQLRGEFRPRGVPTDSWWRKVLAWPIGWVVVWIFILVFPVLSVINIAILLNVPD